jgi:hypothetical protein
MGPELKSTAPSRSAGDRIPVPQIRGRGKGVMLNKNFREHEKEVWKQLSEEIGGRFNHREEGEGRFDTVKAKVGPWTITLDLHADASYAHEVMHTRFRAPYINPDGFRFNICKASLWDEMSTVFGGQDVEVGDAAFDENFRIRASDEDKVKDLFENDRLRELLMQEPNVHLYVRDSGVGSGRCDR